MNGPHIAPADTARMTERYRAEDARLDADPGVRSAREKYLARLEAYETARRELEAASYELGQATRDVLRA